MTTLKRKAGALWGGNLKVGTGMISTESKALFETPYSFSTRFEEEDGSNPEELIAAAHAACYSMAFANVIDQEGYDPISIDTQATCFLEKKEEGGFGITKMKLHIRGEVDGLDDEETFLELAKKADQGCPVSNLLRQGLEIEHQVELV
jgi:osmotically inducible protein OsmC